MMATEGDQTETVLRMDRRKVLFAFFAGMVLVLAALSLVKHSGAVRVIGIVGLVFFAPLATLNLLAFIRPPEMIAIGPTGVRSGGMIPKARRNVPWDAISRLRIFRFEGAPIGTGMRMLGVVPADPDAPLWRGQRRSRMTGVPVLIGDRSVSMELEEVVALMRRFRPDLEVEYGEPRAAGMGKIGRPSQWRRR